VQDEKVVPWFYRVLRNAVIDHYRHRSVSANAMEVWGRDFTKSQEPEAELWQEICQCVSGLLTTLKPEYRDALRIVDLEDGNSANSPSSPTLQRKMRQSEYIVHGRLFAVRWNWHAGVVPSTAVWIAIASQPEARTARRPTRMPELSSFEPVNRQRGRQMEYLIGLLLSLAVAGLVAITGLERDRALYPTVLIINASYYLLFAVMNTRD
jgi:hypothetical protein